MRSLARHVARLQFVSAASRAGDCDGSLGAGVVFSTGVAGAAAEDAVAEDAVAEDAAVEDAVN